MKTLNICTYNVRNDNLIEGFDENRIAKLYKKLTKDYEIDILTTQEMISSTVKILKEHLKNLIMRAVMHYVFIMQIMALNPQEHFWRMSF